MLAEGQALRTVSAVRGTLWTQIQAYHELTKPNLTFLVLLTGLFGYYLGSGGFEDVRWTGLLAFLVGTAMTAGGACALNMVLECDIDRACGGRRSVRSPPAASCRSRPGSSP
ncbi:MAG: hypothetical protein HC923_11825 [Myxococcales bacterium]|nr:hypothetical protein [Myxococcales bacterium]